MEGHRLEVAVGIAGLRMFLSTMNPWVLGIGVVAVSAVAVVGIVSGSYVACKGLKVACKPKDQERKAGD